MLHETINIMTLGGMALAVGILVDDATVAIENINRNLETGQGAGAIDSGRLGTDRSSGLVSTLSICIVFVPMFFLSGVARYLFVPMAEAVVFAMLASYLLSRTLVPTMAKYLLHEHDDARKHASGPAAIHSRGFSGFESGFRGDSSRLPAPADAVRRPRRSFSDLPSSCLPSRRLVCLSRGWGQDFFPSVDSGQFKIHVRAHTGTRIEETALLCDHVDSTIRARFRPMRW
jgi:multidrug efflux pump subunit AcrB